MSYRTNINNPNYNIYNGNSISTLTKKVIQQSGKNNNSSCVCPNTNNNKQVLTNSNNIQGQTQNQRISNIVNNYLGGKTQFGNTIINNGILCNNISNPITLLGRTEGQPGGIIISLKNKF